MIPDLGKYATPVLSAYAISILLLSVLVILMILRARHVARRLEKVEHAGRDLNQRTQ